MAATHGVLSGPAIDRLKNAPIKEVILTNTLPIEDGKQFPELRVLSIAPIIADALDAVFEDTSRLPDLPGRQPLRPLAGPPDEPILQKVAWLATFYKIGCAGRAERLSMATMKDGAILRLAGRQHGLVTTRQLIALGYSKHGIRRRIEQACCFGSIGACTRSLGRRTRSTSGSWRPCWRPVKGLWPPIGALPLCTGYAGSAVRYRR